MKKFLFLIFASLLVLGACGQDEDNSNKDDNKKSESKSDKKSNDPKKDKKLENKDKSNKSTNDDKQQASSDDSNNDTANNEYESTSKNDNGKTQNANGNERPQGKTVQPTQQNNQQQANNNQQQSSNQQSQNNNNYMTQDEINEWNKNKPTTHDESQMGYGRAEYEKARKASEQVWDDPNAHVGGPIWVGKNEGYDSWAKRQQEVQNTPAQ
ncbi:hypothetical protein [Staphylococcus sp. HMSC074A11]|uniref:hypothetical protein n=1 Tax=Staphylococcus sp. HMSC074A11 TaxID=1715201 RepID=UPI0008A11419|nr:hypothetical protein [Staphylococcus sp. HMSC074A11]OFM07517.1 hypothetical protein HMPREF2722_09355 [Staphylococcus sp. HMSC074A11]